MSKEEEQQKIQSLRFSAILKRIEADNHRKVIADLEKKASDCGHLATAFDAMAELLERELAKEPT